MNDEVLGTLLPNEHGTLNGVISYRGRILPLRVDPSEEDLSFARLTNRSMTGTLNDLEFHCGIELEYHDDLRKVQRNLNDMPHVNRDPCIPFDAVTQLLEGSNVGGFGAPH